MEKLNKQNAEEKITKLLEENHIFAEVGVDLYVSNGAVISVEISWGDWKHDHLRADWLIKEAFGLENIGTETTEEDGSDCYSGIHRYIVIE